jgi:hypothetical protein
VYTITRRPNNCLVRERQAGSRLLPNPDPGLPLDRQAVASTHLRRRSSLPAPLVKLVGDIPPPAPRYVAPRYVGGTCVEEDVSGNEIPGVRTLLRLDDKSGGMRVRARGAAETKQKDCHNHS